MRRVLAVVGCLVAALALAGESAFLGTIAAPADGGVANNTTTTAPFYIPPGSKVTLECDFDARVLTDARTVARSGSAKGLRVPVSTLFPTSVGSKVWALDAGAGQVAGMTSVIAVTSADAGTAVNCDVWQRSGTE